MKEIDLNVVGLEPLREEEVRDVDGGIGVVTGIILGAVAGALVSTFITEFQDVREGWSDGINGRKPRH